MDVKQGWVYLYYVFDIANEIRLEKLEKVFGKRPVESQFTYKRITPNHVSYSQPPLSIKLGTRQKDLGDGVKLNFRISAKFYDFGAVSFKLSFPFSGTFAELTKISARINGNSDLEKDIRHELERIKAEIQDVLVGPAPNTLYEDYIVFHIQTLEKPAPALDFVTQNANALAKIIRSDSGELSDSLVKETLRNSLSYYVDDLVILDWSAALILDPFEITDTLEIIEFATIEALELRVYDSVLESELEKTYASIDKVNSQPWFILAIEPFSPVLMRLEATRMDVVEIIDKVENTLKLVGDPYPVRVYRSAAESFRIKEWKSNVKDKLDTMEEFYDTLVGRIQTNRLLLLEFFMLLIFLVEFVLLLLPVLGVK
ncbi:hypothetical protein HY990_01455 [Candidatus Micrarchaeota archaeon]|nr:hypothetical protein [Candidatus Micrarchaeota archaeon]